MCGEAVVIERGEARCDATGTSGGWFFPLGGRGRGGAAARWLEGDPRGVTRRCVVTRSSASREW